MNQEARGPECRNETRARLLFLRCALLFDANHIFCLQCESHRIEGVVRWMRATAQPFFTGTMSSVARAVACALAFAVTCVDSRVLSPVLPCAPCHVLCLGSALSMCNVHVHVQCLLCRGGCRAVVAAVPWAVPWLSLVDPPEPSRDLLGHARMHAADRACVTRQA